jgi:hypothetical protein
MAFISLDSPSCEVPCLILVSVVYRDVTRQAKGLYRLKYEVALKRGLAYLSWCNSDWFCHSAILRDQFGILPKRRAIGYTKPYPSDYDLIPLPPKYRLPEFTKFSGAEGSSSIEHVSRYLALLGMISVSDPLRVKFFSQSLTGPAFGWYTSLGPDSIRTWKQLEEQFHIQYHSEAAEAGIADLAQVRQNRGETMAEFVRRFKEVKNRCY